jgi:hypothetical protein
VLGGGWRIDGVRGGRGRARGGVEGEAARVGSRGREERMRREGAAGKRRARRRIRRAGRPNGGAVENAPSWPRHRPNA